MAAPATGFNIYAGTSGDFQVVALSYTPGFNTVVVPGVPPVPTSMIEASKWGLDISVASPEFVGFGSPVEANGLLGKLQVRGGIVDWSVDIEGAVNGNSAAGLDTFSRLRPGIFVLFHLVLDAATGYGFRSLAGKVMSFGPSADVKDTSNPSPYRVKIKGQGTTPLPAFGP